MKTSSLLVAVLLAATVAFVPASSAATKTTKKIVKKSVALALPAPVVHFLGAGSSAMYQGFGVAAYNDMQLAQAQVSACSTGGVFTAPCVEHHWSTAAANANAYLKDTRTNSHGTSPAPQFGNLWLVWVQDANGNVSDVWGYLSVDSSVGVRNYLATPRALLVITAAANAAGANGISHVAFFDGSSDTNIPQPVLTALNEPAGIAITAGMTDIRPEDALLATYRILGDGVNSNDNATAPQGNAGNGCATTLAGDTEIQSASEPNCWYIYSFALGYSSFDDDLGNGQASAAEAAADGIGAPIISGEPGSTANALPVLFGLPGTKDPLSGLTVPATVQVFPVGESPILFVANRSDTVNGMGQVIGNGGGAGNNDDGALSGSAYGASPYNTGQPAGYISDGSYYVRNVWDQHPWPATNVFPSLTQAAGAAVAGGTACDAAHIANDPGGCHVTRRPLGNLFSGGDCETDSSAFTWPLDPSTEGLRATVPNRTPIPMTLFLREPLSGTYNTTEFTEIRRFGTTGGSTLCTASSTGGCEFPPYVSQESNVIQPGDSSLNKQCQAKFNETASQQAANEGYRVRGIGTGEVTNGPSGLSGVGDGALNTPDSLAYTFFSFSNVSKLSKSAKYGYLMIDATDGLFDNYENAVPGLNATSTGNGANVEGEPICEGTGAAAALCPLALPYPTTSNPGQVAKPGAGNQLTWGQIPACSIGAGGLGCRAQDIWRISTPEDASVACPVSNIVVLANDGVMTAASNSLTTATSTPFAAGMVGESIEVSGAGPGGGILYATIATFVANNSVTLSVNAATTTGGATVETFTGTACTFPHIRDGSYPAWSELRMICDNTAANCMRAMDPTGAEALVQALQQDIHNGANFSTSDFLPFDGAGSYCGTSGCEAGNWTTTGYGDGGFIRDHYQYQWQNDPDLHGQV
ncbi:MAG: hypothetical protein ACLP6G_11655, partial [Terriglobales bacterium]